MIKPIFIKELKSNYKMLLVLCAVITMYEVMVIYMYNPDLLKMMNYFVESMPELVGMMNMNGNITSLLSFISNYLYGFLLLVLPLILIITISVRLVCKYIDNGSLAYYLNSKYTRKQIILNQFLVCVTLVLGLMLYSYVVILISSQVLFPNELDIFNYSVVHLGLVALQIFVLGLSFMISCIFNEASKAYTWIISITTGSLLIQMLSGIGDSFSWLNNFSFHVLFDTQGLSALNDVAIFKSIFLLVIGVVFAIYGMNHFIKKDLPL